MEGPYLILLRKSFRVLARNIVFLCIHVVGLHKKFQRRCEDLKLDVRSLLLPFWQSWIQATNLLATVGEEMGFNKFNPL
jgi:hypothetical protein